jgi:hypothetical protein
MFCLLLHPKFCAEDLTLFFGLRRQTVRCITLVISQYHRNGTTLSETAVSTLQLSGSHGLLCVQIGSVWIHNRTVNAVVEIKHQRINSPDLTWIWNTEWGIVRRHESSAMTTIVCSRITASADYMGRSSCEVNRRPTLVWSRNSSLFMKPEIPPLVSV